MHFAHGDVRDHIVYAKTVTYLCIAAKEGCSGRDGLESTFARFSAQFDFRLFQRYRRKAAIALDVNLLFDQFFDG